MSVHYSGIILFLEQMSLRGLPHSAVSPLLREPYILSGYRPVGLSPVSCVRSILRWDNNEVVNFWTHFLPLVLWVYWLILSYKELSSDTRYLPLLCYWFGGIACVFFSSFAHLFNAISYKFRHFCFFMDYTGIALYEMGANIAIFYYYRPLNRPAFQYEYPFLGIAAILTVGAVPITCLSRFYWRKNRFIIRSLAHMQPFLWANFLIWVLYLFPDGSEKFIYEHLNNHFVAFGMSVLLLFFFSSKIPERFAPGKFDIIGGSHQWSHVCSATTATIHLWVIKIDVDNRWPDLSTQSVQPTFLTTIWLLGLCAFLMVTISSSIFYFVYKGVIVEEDNVNKEK